MAGRSKEAVPIYVGLADEFARSGHAPKAIAILKKIEQLSPGRSDVANRLAALIGDHGTKAATAPPAPADAMHDYEPARSVVPPRASAGRTRDRAGAGDPPAGARGPSRTSPRS